MKKTLIAKRDALLANRKNKNKGFTLVELVVVIVILAILIGVTIGGVFTYVNKSRTNTDANNAASIQSALSVISTDQAVYTWAKGANDTAIVVKWKDVAEIDTSISTPNAIQKAVQSILTDGLPKSQTGQGFELTITPTSSTGDVKVTCKVATTAVSSASDLDKIGMKSTTSTPSEDED